MADEATRGSAAAAAARDPDPALPPPAAGTGHLVGEVRYAEAPAANVEVKLCEQFSQASVLDASPSCRGKTYKATTDSRGTYVFRDLPAKTYGGLMARVFDEDLYQYVSIMKIDKGFTTSAEAHTVTAGEVTRAQTTDLVKHDLQISAPRSMVRTSPTPSIRWASYPAATHYEIKLQREKSGAEGPVVGTTSGTTTTWTPPPLARGRWKLSIAAFLRDKTGPRDKTSPRDERGPLAETANPLMFIVPDAEDPTPLDSSDDSPSPPAPPARPARPEFERVAPATGMGALQGLVLYDDRSVQNIGVKLCETYDPFYSGCGGKVLAAKTDARGVYTFPQVDPKTWGALLVRVFKSSDMLVVTTGLDTRRVAVVAGETAVLEPANLFKSDLRILAPKRGAKVTAKRFEVKWAPYPGAASYALTILKETGHLGSYLHLPLERTSFVLDQPLENGSYSVNVTALNAWGTRLAETGSAVKFTVAAK